QRFHGGSWVSPGHRNMARPAEMGTKERNLKQAALGQKAELRRYVREGDGRIHKTQMIRNEYVATRGINPVEAFHMDPDPTYDQQRSGPGPRDADLQSAGVIKERDDQADGAEKNGCQNDCRIGKQQTAQLSHQRFILVKGRALPQPEKGTR